MKPVILIMMQQNQLNILMEGSGSILIITVIITGSEQNAVLKVHIPVQ